MSATKPLDSPGSAPVVRRWHTSPGRSSADSSCVADLIAVLAASPSGLRRWSVMRAMRARAAARSREIPPKFEDDVERVFRRHCADDSVRAGMTTDPASELFYRPNDRAGEVWALNTEQAKAWLEGSDGPETR